MRRALLLPLLIGLCVSAQGQSPRWSRVSHLRPATLIEVQGLSTAPERCMFGSIDTTTLHCIADSDGAELVFPLSRIGVVYQVLKPRWGAAAWVSLGGFALAIASAATQNIGGVAVGLVISLCALIKATPSQPPHDRLKVIYWR